MVWHLEHLVRSITFALLTISFANLLSEMI
ncbi:hypothetical protein PKCBPO_00800 [Methylorubrum thiocyanatum]